MPRKSGTVIPDWIREVSGGNDCLNDVLEEAWFAGEKALAAIDERGGGVPRTCAAEMRSAEIILENIRTGRVPEGERAEKAAQAVRKFATARQCARFLERDNSPTFADEQPLQRGRVF
jgi:hypothetical protein